METSQLIASISLAYQHLFGDDVVAARDVARSASSPYHDVALGLISFLEGAVGLEHAALYESLQLLSQGEATANVLVAKKEPKSEALAARVLAADSLSSQAVVHIFLESYSELMKAVYKLNRAYSQIKAISAVVFATPVLSTDSQAEIVDNLNQMYLASTSELPKPVSSFYNLAAKANGSHSSLFGWRKSKRPALQHAYSDSLGNGNGLQIPNVDLPRKSSTSDIAALGDTLAVPAHTLSAASSQTSLVSYSSERAVAPLWEHDHVWTFIIGGAAWGRGIFGLIMSCLPPKIRKLVSWFGFEADRELALRLLTLSSTTSEGPHAAFGSLTLITYYTLHLQLCGWEVDKARDIATCETILARFERRFPQGSLAALNRAKIARARADSGGAIAILEETLAKGSGFKQAQGLLVFELSMCYLADSQHLKSADSFIRLRSLNTWSHPTYVWIAAGALLALPAAERTPAVLSRVDELLTELSELVGQKRILGHAPATEVFIVRRMNAYKTKHARWVRGEIGYLWNANASASQTSLMAQQSELLALQDSALDSTGEILIRDLLLSQIARYLSDFALARTLLESILAQKAGEETWTGSYALFELAVLECVEGDRDGDNTDWEKRLDRADKYVDRLFARPTYDMRNRLEARALMLREELAKKRAAVASR